MKSSLVSTLLLSLVSSAMGGGQRSNLNSCFAQSSCLKFTMTKVSTSACAGEACEWEVCMTYDQDLPDCTKTEPISHICHKEFPGVCHDATSAIQDLAQGILLEAFPEDYPTCQIVKPGSYAGFLVKDSNDRDGCSALTPTGSPVTLPVEDCDATVQCAGIADVSEQCAGNGVGQISTCNWGFKTPKCGIDKCGGDPHISRWGHLDLEQQRFAFHGQCDLVLMHTPNFENGLGLDLHIRTTSHRTFSFIENAALRIGENTVEIHSGGVDRNPHQLWLNGDTIEEKSQFPISKPGFELSKMDESDEWDTYEVTLPVGDKIRFHVQNQFITIETHGSTVSFDGTVGLKGDFETGALLARDGVTKMDHDTDTFGQEWQVRDSDPELFRDFIAPQWPQKCIMPQVDANESRRLAYSQHDSDFLNKAEVACSTVSNDDIEFCMFDVLATGDLVMAKMFDHRARDF